MLKLGVVSGAALCALGLLVPSAEVVLWAGIVMVMVTPLAGVVASTASLVHERDLWAKAGIVLIAVIAIGLVLSLA
ncbi:MAG: hypothetical protein LBS92_03375 [Candidatus Methanoplasma sp.]|nr:hypothetical protein [Candidatus Methanoplasma sp.]